jgi:hypothetical protein
VATGGKVLEIATRNHVCCDRAVTGGAVSHVRDVREPADQPNARQADQLPVYGKAGDRSSEVKREPMTTS